MTCFSPSQDFKKQFTELAIHSLNKYLHRMLNMTGSIEE